VVDSPRVRRLIADVRELIGQADSPERSCELIGPLFAGLLADRDWLPAPYQALAAKSGMGGGIGQWLVFRAADRSLSLFSLVVPPGAITPVHDHLAWGLVGIYRGNQDEEFYVQCPAGGLTSCAGARWILATSTRCCRRETTSIESGRRHTRHPYRSTC